jgi:hypothetical protein
VAFGLSFCAFAHGQTETYQAPAKWNHFNVQSSSVFRPASTTLLFDADAQQVAEKAEEVAEQAAEAAAKKEQMDELPIPAFVPAERPLLDENGEPLPPPEPVPSVSSACNAACAAPVRSTIAPWFAGGELLFFNVANNSHGRSLAIGDANGIPYLSTADVRPEANTGFSAHIGRYLNCGRSALDVGYFLFNPSEATVIARPGAAGDWRTPMPAWNNIELDPGTGADSVYMHFDGASAYRARRDMFFQGIEANINHFGLMGARRVGTCGTNGFGRFGRMGYYGGAGGPLARACGGRFQIQTLQGFRWFQLEDEFELAANIDGIGGYQADDVYYNVETENNLFGYQVGGRSTFCLYNRLNLGIGGKIGIYGNHAEYRQRLGTQTTLAYINGTTDSISTVDSKDVLAALGELDLGLGYRLSNAWTVRGGYRLLAACGVATAVDNIANDHSSLAASSYVSADDCVILHGGYVGMEYNF